MGLLRGWQGESEASACRQKRERPLGQKTDALSLWLPVSAGLLVLGLELLGLFGAAAVYTGVFALAAFASLVLGQRGSASLLERAQARWLLWGAALPAVIFVAVRLPLLVLDMEGDPTDDWILLASLALPVGAGVGILRYRLFEIDVVLRRTALGVVAAPVALFCYHLLVSVAAGGAAIQVDRIVLAAVFLTILLAPLQAGMEGFVDKVLRRNRHSHRQLLSELPEELVNLRTSAAIADRVLGRLAGDMQLQRVLIAVGPLHRFWERGGCAPPADLQVWASIEELDSVGFADHSPVGRWMSGQGLVLLLPLRTAETRVGILGVSADAHGSLDPDDVGLLRSVAGALALALSNALAFETIKQINHELEQSERRYRELFQSAPVAIVQATLDGTCVAANEAFHQLAGPGESSMVQALGAETWQELVRELQLDRSLGRREVTVGGHPALVNAQLRQDEVGWQVHAILIDLRQQRQLEQAEKLSGLGTLASGIAHDFRNHLATVQLSAEYLLESLDGEGAEAAGDILVASSAASELSTDLLALARPGSGEHRLIDMDALVGQLGRFVQRSLRGSKVRLDLQSGVSIMGSAQAIRHCLLNLCLNARDAMPEGGTVTLSTRRLGEELELSVRDEGLGMAPEVASRVFDAFFTTKGTGTGLGLSMVRSIIEAHGGRIQVESTVGEGSTFLIRLPVRSEAV